VIGIRSYFKDKLCGCCKLEMLTPWHLSLQESTVNLISFTRPSGEGSMLSGKLAFSTPEGLVMKLPANVKSNLKSHLLLQKPEGIVPSHSIQQSRITGGVLLK
jgi:hypothetical protein